MKGRLGTALHRARGRMPAIALLLGGLAGLAPATGHAVPSFARQTGVGCAACHTVFPELTAFGRAFKLRGYTMANDSRTGLDRTPVAVMIQASDSLTRTPSGGARDDFPKDRQLALQQASLFLAGRISDHSGGFIQATYDGIEQHSSLDLVDLRHVWNPDFGEHDTVVGVTVNNAPGVQDGWNTLPIWGFPYAASSLVQGPAAASVLDGALAVQVAGLTAYAMVDDRCYAELGAYRKGRPGLARALTAGNSLDTVVDGLAPYWRLNLQRTSGGQTYSVGTFGVVAKIFPDGADPRGATDQYTDVGLDGQYLYTGGDYSVSAHLAWTHEKQDRSAGFSAGAVEAAASTLRSTKLDLSYVGAHRYAATIGYQRIVAGTDAILYPSGDPVVGSRLNRPDSDAILLEFDYLPLEWVKLTAQVTAYTRFNGASSNYDGFGRSASDNDSVYLLAWIMH